MQAGFPACRATDTTVPLFLTVWTKRIAALTVVHMQLEVNPLVHLQILQGGSALLESAREFDQ